MQIDLITILKKKHTIIVYVVFNLAGPLRGLSYAERTREK